MGWTRPTLRRQDFENFIAQITPTLLKTAFLLTWREPDAQDLVQETLTRIARHWTAMSSMEYPEAYARRILINLCAGTAGSRKRAMQELQLVDDDRLEDLEDPDIATDEFEVRTELLHRLGGLPNRQRVVLVLRYYEDMSEGEIAEALNWPVGTVKSTTSRALERLQRMYLPHTQSKEQQI